jgi:stage II sporulation protein AB (anti-sigma F factor)
VTKIRTCLELELPAVPASVREARIAVGDTVAELADVERIVDEVELCVSEAVTNVVRHAYGTRTGAVEVVVEQVDTELNVVVRDHGRGMTASRRRAKPGGFGLKIIGKLARRHSVKSTEDAGTEIRIVFAL